MKRYYRFSHHTFRNRNFTWAQSIIPRSSLVNTYCRKCGTWRRYPSGEFDVVLEGGQVYPDILGCGAFPFLILSENAVHVLRDAGITSFTTYMVGMKEIKAQSLLGKQPPVYYRVEIHGKCAVDVEGSGVKIKKYCKKCHSIETEPILIREFKLKKGSWNGELLFRDESLYPFVSFCTQDVVDLVRRNQLSNFQFKFMGELAPMDTQ